MMQYISRIASIGIDLSIPNDQVIRIRILNVICVIAIVVITMLYAFRDVLFGRYDLAFFHFLLVLVFIPPLILNRLKRFNSARLFLFILFPVSLIPYNYFLADIGSENYLFSLVLLCFLLLEKTSTQFIVSFYCTLVFIAIKILLRNDLGLTLYADSADELFYFNTSQAFIVVTLCSFVYSYQNKQHHLKLEQANKEALENNALVKNLLKELNHRVKNNLQMISSLFNIQALSANDPFLKDKLAEAMNRIQVLSLVYEKLYRKEINSNISLNLSEYLHEQINFLVGNFFGVQPVKIHIDIPDNIFLGVDETMHIGLITNELITNVHKYGLAKDETNLTLVITQNSNGLSIVVYDNGSGFPAHFDPENTKGFGYDLIRVLVQKYNGSLHVANNNGAVVTISLQMG
jgi:two-component sensor histidine kinase